MSLETSLVDLILFAALLAAAIKFILFEIQSVCHAWQRTFPAKRRDSSDAMQP
jgi:hypothetical protein